MQCRLKYKDDPVKSQAIPALEVIQYAKGNGMKVCKKTNDFHTMAHLYLWADNNALGDLLKAQSIDTIKIEMLEKPIVADVEMVGDAGSEFDEEEEQDDLFVDEGAAKEIEEALDPLPKNLEGEGEEGGETLGCNFPGCKTPFGDDTSPFVDFCQLCGDPIHEECAQDYSASSKILEGIIITGVCTLHMLDACLVAICLMHAW